MTQNNVSLKGIALVMTVSLLSAPLAVFLFAVPLDVGGDPPFSSNKLVNVVNSESQQAPSIVVDSTGNIFVAWEDIRSTTDWDIYFANSTDGGTTWSVPNEKINSDATATDQENPSLAVDDAGTLFVAWENDTAGEEDIGFANSTDGGATWSSPHVIINTDGLPGLPQEKPAIAVNSTNEVYVVWQDARSGTEWDIYFSKSMDGGATWMNPNIRVNNDLVNAPQFNPTIAVDNNGVIYTAWEDERDGNPNIYFAKSTDGGSTWSNPNIKVNTNVSVNRNPSITVDSSGNIYLAWQDNRNGHSDIYYAMSSDSGTTWSDPNARVNNDVGTAEQTAPSIVVNSTGAIFVAWEDFRWGDYDVYFAVSEDMGATWSDPNLRVNDDTGPTDQEKPSLVAGPGGSAFVAWQDYRSTDNYEIYFAHLTPPPPPPTVDYIEITDGPNGALLAGGIVPTGFLEWGNCSAYNNSAGYLYTVSANWTVEGGMASLLGATPAVMNGIDVGTTEVTVFLNASYGGFVDSVEYTVSGLTVDYIDITDTPDGTPLAGGSVPVGFSEWGNCSAYNNSAGYLYTVSANWSADGGTASLLGVTPAVSNGIDVGSTEVIVWLNASYGVFSDSVQYTVIVYTVDYIEITDIPGGTQLAGGTVLDNFMEWGNCSAYNNSAGYLYTVSANWSVNGGTATLLGTSPNVMNGIDVGGTAGEVWLNASDSGHMASVKYIVTPPTVDYIMITHVPDGTPLAGGFVPFDFEEWGNCSAYNDTAGFIGLVSANWTVEGGASTLLGATPAEFNGIAVGAVSGTIRFNATYMGKSDVVIYTVGEPSVDYIILTDVPGGTALAGGTVPVGFSEWGYCSVYNDSTGYIGTQNAAWSVAGGASLLGSTPEETNGIDVGLTVGTVWLNVTYNGYTDSVEYTVSPPEVEYIEITDVPDGTPLAGGSVPVGFTEWGNCSLYNSTMGYMGTGDASWTAVGGNSELIGGVPLTMNGIDVGTQAGTVTFTATYNLLSDSVVYTVLEPGVDYIIIRDAAGGLGNVLDTATFTVGDLDTFYAAGYNSTSGYVEDVAEAVWNVTGGIGSATTPGASTSFYAAAAGVGRITVIYGGISNESGDITVPVVVVIYAPSQPQIESKGEDFIEISWPANSETNLGGYRVYRKMSPDDDWTLLDSVGVDVTTYKDSGLESGTTYYYSLTAVDDADNESPRSASVNAKTDKPADDGFPWMILIIIIVIVLLLLILAKKKPKEKGIPEEMAEPEEEIPVEEPEEEEPSDLVDEEVGEPVEGEPDVEEDYEGAAEGEEEYSDSDDVEEVK